MDVDALCRERGWTRSKLVHEMRKAASAQGWELPGDDSLRRMIRQWTGGARTPGAQYASLLGGVFGLRSATVGPEEDGELSELLDRGDCGADLALVASLEAQTQSLRILDRRLGAARLLEQAEAHARTIADLVKWSPVGEIRRGLAAAGAEAAALAGWQALDLGRPKSSWELHAQARSLALESEDECVLAHVTAQQAYALLDTGRVERAANQFAAARRSAGSAVCGVARTWLAAAEAEARAAMGDRVGAVKLLDLAERSLDDEGVPFIVLDHGHLARWRGHCLARLGDDEAVTSLNLALDAMGTDFMRASASLHADLATAYVARGDQDAARHHAGTAARLCLSTGSRRQRARVAALLLDAEGE